MSETNTDAGSGRGHDQSRDLNVGTPHSARMYDYYLGGRDNYQADRQAAAKVLTLWPSAMIAARVNRAFMRCSTRVAATLGIRQFLDIGTGIPTSPNLHDVAQEVCPEARVVYTDNDPVVLVHARALLNSGPKGSTQYVEADITDPQAVLRSPQLTGTLDMDQPVAVSLNALLHFVPDESDPYGIVRSLLDAFPKGSSLSISHVTPDMDPETIGRVVEVYHQSGIPGKARTKAEVEQFFDGLRLLDPGIVMPHQWRPEEDPAPAVLTGDVGDAEASGWVGMAIKD